MVVGGSVIKDSEEPSIECPVGGYHQWEEDRTATAHVCALCGKVSPVKCFEHPVSPPAPVLHPTAAPVVTTPERQAS